VAGGIAAVVGEELSSSKSTRPHAAPPTPRGTPNPRGEQPYSFAGHLHSSFSEFGGSNEAQALQAKASHLDALAMTEHDFRMLFQGCRPGFPFTAMSVHEGDGTWQLIKSSVGTLGPGSQGRIDVSSTYPSGGALLMTAVSGGGAATLAFELNCGEADADYRGNVGGRTISVDVFPERPSTPQSGYLALLIELSLHPSIDTDPLHVYYRLNTAISAKQYSVAKGTGYVDVPTTSGKLQTITPDPTVDFPKLWPDLDPLDNSFVNLAFVATATTTGGTAQGWFSNLRFVTDPTYDANAAIHSQQKVAGQAFSRFAPSILVMPGVELSRDVHVRQLDGTIFLPDYPPSPLPHPVETVEFTTNMVKQIHEHNSAAVLCHPYGTELHSNLLSQTQQDRKLTEVAKKLTTLGAYGVDVIEAGYQDRNGVDIEHHQMLWRVLSRRGHVLTADGVSDDHTGANWSTQTNRFITYLWTKELSTSNLSTALMTGRAYVGELSSFSGELDLWFDDFAVTMGQVSLLNSSGTATRTLWVRADRLPAGSQVNIWRAPIDYTDGTAGTPDGVPTDDGVLLGGGAPIDASRFASGPVSLTVDTSTACFFWADVLDSTGRTIAFSNMIYQLREAPPSGAPAIASTRLVSA
jgi:hypothetical protein